MSTRTTLAFSVALLIVAASAFAQNRGPSTPEERSQAVRLAHSLETDPIGPDAKAARQTLTVFLVEAPDIRVPLCGEFVRPLLGAKKNYAAELLTQMLYSSGAFVIEHPEKATDDEALYLGGLEGTLRAYESILKAKPKAHWPFLDQLLERRDKGELASYVHELTPKCTN
jgi:hypothetical protein